MNRRGYTLAFVLNCGLALLLVLSFGSGWYASLMEMTEFGLHKWSSVALVSAIGIHVGLHGRMLTRRRRR